jgi:glycosyltransferase involved in cell wall biosynthesis
MKKSDAHIAYIVSAGTGLESFVYREIDYLIAQNVNISLFTTKLKKGDVYAPKENWPTFSLSLFKLICLIPFFLFSLLKCSNLLVESIKKNSVIDLLFALYFSKKMKKQNVKQIHCHFGDHKLFIGYYCSKLLGLPLSVTIHSHELHVNPNEEMFKIAIIKCDKVYAISKLAIDILINRYSVDENKLELNRLCVDTNEWTHEKPFRVLTVGRFQPQKGFKYLFEAAKILKEYNVEFVIVGFGPLDLEALAHELGIYDKFVFFNKMNCKQLQFLYQNCDIYCLPSITHPTQGKEGVPVVLMESMASGLPVVATDCGAVSEIVVDMLVDESSPEQLASAILRYMQDDDLLCAHKTKNRSIVKEKYSIKNIEEFSCSLVDIV